MKHLSNYSKKYIKELRNIARKIPGFQGVRHIHPRCYVVAKPAGWCAIVATPTMDNEPQIAGIESESIHHKSAKDVKLGDWVSVGYVSTSDSGQQIILAINGKPVKQ